jgi:hypothetical protein
MATSTKKDLTVKEGFTFNIPLILKNKQADFFYDVNALSPHTVLKLNRMDGSYRSILLTIPDALKNIFLAPFILAPKKWEMIPFAIENMLLIILITFSKLAPLAIDNRLNTFFQALLFPSWLSLLVIGLILPMAGLIVKYASPAILICTLYYGLKIDWIRLRNTKLINLK